MDFDFDFDFDFNILEEKEEKNIKVKKMKHNYITKKISSEKSLEENLDWHFEENYCYHCFSFGDVDSLSFLKHILKQQKINYCLLSTWCMANDDVEEIKKWYKQGNLKRVDFFVGEIFKNSYSDVYDEVLKFIKECGGRLVVFRNHSKIMAIKGERFDCLIESSANINTNPRSENTVITVNSELTNYYINLFAEIIPFNKDFTNEPFKVEGEKNGNNL